MPDAQSFPEMVGLTLDTPAPAAVYDLVGDRQFGQGKLLDRPPAHAMAWVRLFAPR